MENYKVFVRNEAESKEAQELFIALGYRFSMVDFCKYYNSVQVFDDGSGSLFEDHDTCSHKELTIPQLRDLVVLKRNSIDDATHYYGGSKYYLTDSEFYQYSEGKWVNIDEYVDGMTFKKIENEVKMKEYLELQEDGSYEIVLYYRKEGNGWIKVPEGAEIFLLDKSCGEEVFYFVKHDGEVFHEYYISGTNISHNSWIKGTIKELHNYMGKVLWQRNTTTTLDSNNTVTQEKLKFVEKWLNGEKIQYILGIETDKSQWHNFTEGAMQYIKRPDIKFREAPKYVTINGIEFKSVKSLLKHVKNNFDLEGEE